MAVGGHITTFRQQSLVLEHRLPEVKVPTLVVWGRQDRVLPLAHAHVAERSIPNASLQIFEECGHAPMIEKPDDFNRVVSEFVSDRIS